MKLYLKSGYLIFENHKLVESTCNLDELISECRQRGIDMNGTTTYFVSGSCMTLFTNRNAIYEEDTKGKHHGKYTIEERH